jgi:predicted nucleic acid-binding protein
MGVILDSSILVAAERGGDSVQAILKRVQSTQGETESGLSVVTIAELTHGIYRAKSASDRQRDARLLRSYVETSRSIR